MTTPTPTSSFPRTVCIESPFRNPLPEVPLIEEIYRDYLHDCLRDSLSRGEAPFAGHAYLPFVLDDGDEAERRQGIDCHLAFLERCDMVAVYTDFGLSSGMGEAIRRRPTNGGTEYRRLLAWENVGEYTQGFVKGWFMHAAYGWTHVMSRGSNDGGRRDPTLFRP